jgi:3-oxoacyl-[acyl-carrier protein] reductase
VNNDTLFASLHGKIALVTGAGSGIGAALAQRLGKLGVQVVCTARTKSKIDAVAQSIVDEGGDAVAVSADATVPNQMGALAAAINSQFGGLDLAFLNAGANSQKATILDSDPEDWRRGFDQNLLPVLLGIKISAPLMHARGGGRIIFTGSAMAQYPAEENSSYCAAKAAARMVAQTAAIELAGANITVNEFIPGPVRTEQALKFYSPEDKSSPFNNPAEWVKDPEDVIDTMLFMAAIPGAGPNSQIFSLARR